jgi:hypothetical protein
MTAITTTGVVHRSLAFATSLAHMADREKTNLLGGAVLFGMGRLIVGGIGTGALLGAQVGRGLAEDLGMSNQNTTAMSVSMGIGGAIFGATVPGRALLMGLGAGMLLLSSVRMALGLSAEAMIVSVDDPSILREPVTT